MRELRKKLHSQSGASILLALLFLLACMMVGASVLTAAASNAGKIQSSYEEQQRYLALSSALRLVIDQLEEAKYYGRYTVDKWTEHETIEDKDGNTTVIDKPYYKIMQRPGAFTCGSLAALQEDAEGKLVLDGEGNPREKGDTVLTFQKEMDGLFARQFTGTGYETEVETAGLPTNPPSVLGSTPEITTRNLTVTVTGAENEFIPVKVDVDMSQSLRIHLKAWLDFGTGGDPTYVMEAELTADGNMPTIDYPEDRMPSEGRKGNYTDDNPTPNDPVLTKTAMTWRLDWITREVKNEKKEAGG